jgi:hypothetical protein
MMWTQYEGVTIWLQRMPEKERFGFGTEEKKGK